MLLGNLPGFSGYTFNPTLLVRAVNHLQRIGTTEAVSVLRAYAERAEQAGALDPQNVLLVARVLFVPRDGGPRLPRLALGRPDLAEPTGTRFPLYPLAVHKDIPFLLIGGYMLGGEAQPSLEYVAWCERECELRPAPLSPDDDPLACADELLGSDDWRALNPDELHAVMLRLQGLRAVSSVYPVSGQEEAALLATGDGGGRWLDHRRAYAALGASWDPQIDDYRI